MVSRGADVNIPDDDLHRTPLYVAALNGHLDISKLLVDHGADVNIVSTSGRTPLTVAALYRRYDVCKYLMQGMTFSLQVLPNK